MKWKWLLFKFHLNTILVFFFLHFFCHPIDKQRKKVDPRAPTCFAFTRSIKVVVGAQQLALSVRPAVVDARRQVGAHVHLGRDVGARLESAG